MTSWRDVQGDMERTRIDQITAERILTGTVQPEDAPPGYEVVVRLVKAAAAPSVEGELADQERTIVGMRDVLASRTRSGHRRFSMALKLKLVAATVAAFLVMGTGLAFAGSLPTGLQTAASTVLAKVGISVPNPNSQADSHPAVTATSVPESALFGLCTAWESGQGGEKGKKDQSVEFQRIQAAAGQASVQSFCSGVIAAHNAANPTGQGSGNGTSTADEKSGGRSGDGSENSNRP
jgi:hypothetical protein